ncbi:MAG: hypothetical protein FWC40_07640 [Proteobacteria bacterium]|nr:hypothetical protein [Pseudomonadota bacterium]
MALARRFFVCMSLACACLGMWAGEARADRPFDFSDIRRPIIKWPFSVISFEIVGEAHETKHIVRVSEAFSAVETRLSRAIDRSEPFGDFLMMGMSPIPGTKGYQLILAYNNEHHYVQVTPDGAGTLFTVEAMPTSYVSGVYDVAAYGFRLYGGGVLPIGTRQDDNL